MKTIKRVTAIARLRRSMNEGEKLVVCKSMKDIFEIGDCYVKDIANNTIIQSGSFADIMKSRGQISEGEVVGDE